MNPNSFFYENSLNLTNYSRIDQGFQPEFSRSEFNLEESDISILNAISFKKAPVQIKPLKPANEVSNTIKEIDDLLNRLRPTIGIKNEAPKTIMISQPILQKIDKNEFQPSIPQQKNHHLNNNNRNQKKISPWEIPMSFVNDSFSERKSSDNIQDLEVFLMDKNLKLRKIIKIFPLILNNFNKTSLKNHTFSPIHKYFLSIISNDGNSIGLYCDVKQIEKFLSEVMELFPKEKIDNQLIKLWLLSLRGFYLSKEKYNRIKLALKISGMDNSTNNMSITSTSMTYGNELECIENIDSDEEISLQE